jgi:hypothetical protein
MDELLEAVPQASLARCGCRPRVLVQGHGPGERLWEHHCEIYGTLRDVVLFGWMVVGWRKLLESERALTCVESGDVLSLENEMLEVKQR